MDAKLKLNIDKREQKPLEFTAGSFDYVEFESYPVGDYWGSVSYNEGEWDEIPVVFERKSLGDLFGTMGANYERFRKELTKASAFGIHLILVIEASMRTVAKGYEYSQMEGTSMLKKLAMLHVKYGLEYHFFNDRGEMAQFITETFNAVKRFYVKEKKLPDFRG